jgi:hypothetical protein
MRVLCWILPIVATLDIDVLLASHCLSSETPTPRYHFRV